MAAKVESNPPSSKFDPRGYAKTILSIELERGVSDYGQVPISLE